jgi:hypothetical protein
VSMMGGDGFTVVVGSAKSGSGVGSVGSVGKMDGMKDGRVDTGVVQWVS